MARARAFIHRWAGLIPAVMAILSLTAPVAKAEVTPQVWRRNEDR